MRPWDSPLSIATRHDRKMARIEKLRAELERLEAEAAELHQQYHAKMTHHPAKETTTA